MSRGKYFLLFGNCIVVKGFAQGSICDLQLSRIVLVSLYLCEFLNHSKQTQLDQLHIKFPKHEKDILLGIDILEKEGFGFRCDDPELFPPMNLDFDLPSEITNCIIDVNNKSEHDYENIFSQLEDLGCIAVQIRCYENIEDDFFSNLAVIVERSRITCIELLIMYNENYAPESIKDICSRNLRIKSIIVHSAPFDKVVEPDTSCLAIIKFSRQVISSETHCGAINIELFSPNIPTFTEALIYNSCLNKKIGIDTKGFLKNCPSMKESFGHVSEVPIKEIVRTEKFKLLWKIKKDEIKTCKVCEFRYICTDCRAFIEDEKDLLSKPLKCTYNPYTAIWE